MWNIQILVQILILIEPPPQFESHYQMRFYFGKYLIKVNFVKGKQFTQFSFFLFLGISSIYFCSCILSENAKKYSFPNS